MKIIDPTDLTYIVDGTPTTEILRFDTANKTIELTENGTFTFFDGVTGQCLFSKIKEVLIADSNIIKYDPPVLEMIHDESLELVYGWTFKNAATLKSIRDCGVAYVNSAGVPTAKYACIVTLGTVTAGTTSSDMYFAQSSATDATTATFTHLHTADSFGVNELVQFYSDTNGDGTPDYDLSSYFKVFLRRGGYTFDESNNTEIGYPAITYKKYNFPITHAVDAGVTKDDTTVDGYTGMSITWYATAQSASLGTNGPYNYHVVINGNNHTYDEIYSWVQRQLRLTSDIDADITNVRTGTVAAALVRMDGSTLKTIYQPTVGGVHISNLAAASYNNVAEADDTQAMRTYPYTAAITLEFDSYLQADIGVAKFWIYDAATYPGAGATLLKDASNNDMTGTITQPTAGFSYAWTADKNWIGIAVGDNDAKIAIASGTIEQSTGNKGVFVAGKERWKL